MPPHSNAAELEIRDAVDLHRNTGGRREGEVFSVLISVARTCHKQGIFPRYVENLIRDPTGGPQNRCKKRLPEAVAA